MLADLCDLIVDCKNRTPPEVGPGEEAVGFSIGTPHIVNGRIRLDDAKAVSQETFDIWTARAVPQLNDLVLTREAPVGRVGRIEAGMKVCLGQRTMLLRPNINVADPRFLHYFLLGSEVQNLLLGQASGSTVSHLRVAQVRDLKIPAVPEVAEQRRIGAVLGALDDKIAINERIAATVMELAENHFRQVALEADRTVAMGELVELKYGKSLPATRRVPGRVNVFGSGGVSGTHNNHLVTGPGVIVGRKGTVGAVYWSESDFYPIDTTFYAVPKQGEMTMEYVYFALRNMGLEEMNSDSAVPGLNRDRAYSVPMKVPGSNRVREFTSGARTLFAVHHARQEESRALAALRDTLLPQLMSGRLRVKDAEKIVEDQV
ncbi:restriction endonuclease subunit S [Streptomyces sp. TLI_55]|uniref:restriction endonuclease subunit S n=1 Tax=Streptomyces sp. TLI_55 TaxID=1938861 RepID=UPI001C53A28E|nr:restriction endonuclease subunit S [Streptomyces sp. TLI_55]